MVNTLHGFHQAGVEVSIDNYSLHISRTVEEYTLPRHQNNIILITFNLLLSLFAWRDPGMFSDNEI